MKISPTGNCVYWKFRLLEFSPTGIFIYWNFAYWIFRLLEISSTGISPTGYFVYWKFRLLEISPTGIFAYWIFRLMKISPTGNCVYWKFRLLEISPTGIFIYWNFAYWIFKMVIFKLEIRTEHMSPKTMRNHGQHERSIWWKIMLLGGDFKQILPIKRYGIAAEVLELSIKKSHLWKHFKVLKLVQNMRADPKAKTFAQDILEIGSGSRNDSEDYVSLPADCITHKPLDKIVFSEVVKNKHWKSLATRAILSAYNTEVDKSNHAVLNMMPGEEAIFFSTDTQPETDKSMHLPDDVLHSFKVAGLPPHILKLKLQAIVMILRNLILEKGLCNGTRLQILAILKHLIKCRIVSGERIDEVVFIPRVTLVDTEHFGCELHRKQFPIKLAFAMTINKAQGQTLQFAGLDLIREVFSHGQLYVGISRVPSWECLKVRLRKDNKEGKVKNVVWKEALLTQTADNPEENKDDLNSLYDDTDFDNEQYKQNSLYDDISEGELEDKQ